MEKEVTIFTKIVKCGNSKAIIIDPDTLNYLDLDIGKFVQCTIKKKNED